MDDKYKLMKWKYKLVTDWNPHEASDASRQLYLE